jgi:cellulose synthase/poly-beta-1,6-N-acetylglucosamine synthase-like glycosyltransferase
MNPSFSLVVQAIFWLCLAAVAYAYVAYPLIIFAASRLFGRHPHAPDWDFAQAEAPTVSLVVSALNEEAMIQERIENFLEMDYPRDRLQLIIASDGSGDRTNEIVRSYQEQFPNRVQLVEYPVRRGKATVLNDTVPSASGDIIVFSDANTFFDRNAITNLVRWFADPTIGAVCGKLKLITPHLGTNSDGLYWQYETFLKQCEGRLGALLGSNGAIYAIRRQDYIGICSDTIIDDFMIPLLMKLHTGKRILYDGEAIATEETPADHKAEFRRRTRIGAGGFQSLVRLRRLLWPSYGWSSFTFWSHKLMRWFCPLFLLLMLVSSVLLIDSPLYATLFAGQIAFYSLALVSHYLPGTTLPMRALRLTAMFTSMNVALAVGFWNWMTGLQGGTWQRTERQVAPQLAARRATSSVRRPVARKQPAQGQQQ